VAARTSAGDDRSRTMTSKQELEARFWKAIEHDRTVMLGCAGVHARPMTAQVEDGRAPIWFFTARDNHLAEAVRSRAKEGVLMLASKGHEVFATVGGQLSQDNDPARIDRLWNPFVAAWFPQGKDDPKLRLLRFEPNVAEIWLNENSLFAGLKMLFGRDPKKDYRDDVATLRLGRRSRR
jgi:general stress protein 26